MAVVDDDAVTALWRQIHDARSVWLGRALSTQPADRPAAEDAIGELYVSMGRRPPRFAWAASPEAGAELAPPGTTRLAEGSPRLVDAELATLVSRLRRRMTVDTGPPWHAPPPPADPRRALRSGRGVRDVVSQFVYQPLRTTAQDALAARLRAALPPPRGLAWAGQHDVAWVAALDVLRQAGAVRFGPGEEQQLDWWTRIAGSCGCWWPREDVCVIAERPATVRMEHAGEDGELRLHSADGPAIRYADGWSVHAWHGTRVPGWVIDAPTAERIAAEPNVEVRRCAIEHIGWQAYIEQAQLTLLARADDPGNPGCELLLYDLPTQPWSRPSKVLLTVNGSAERDGTRRRYGLGVPAWLDDPLDAAGWSYGLSGHQYAQLQRRT